MILFLRILFCIASVVVFNFGGFFVAMILLGKEHNNRQKVLTFGYFVNTVALAVFFTLFMCQKGII